MKKFTLYTLAAFMLMLQIACAKQNAKSEIKHISAKELKEKIDKKENIVLLDVRTTGEYTGPLGNIKGSILIPLQELNQRYTELNDSKDKEIVIYCRSGNRSQVAAKILMEKGFNVVNMVGGMKAWNKL